MANRSDEQENTKIGLKLQSARESFMITQQEMADAVGLTKNHISKIERGQSKASIDTLLGYCKKLGVTPNEILGFVDDEIPSDFKKLIASMSPEDRKRYLEIGKVLKQ